MAHERLKLEDELREVSVLKERDRLRAALLSSIGHDLRTPLTGVAGAIEAVAAQYPQAAALPVARAEVARVRRFLDNLLEMVRLDTGTLQLALEPIDLADAIGGAVHDLQVPPALPFVLADPRLLHHILINLLANAAQHGGEGVITIEGRRTSEAVLLSIRDRGPGLAIGSEKLVFETFARGQGSDRAGGSGLGLAIVKGFADAMGMSVEARNRPEGGAEFTLQMERLVVPGGVSDDAGG